MDTSPNLERHDTNQQEPRKVALITGASSGIGRASAIALAKAGWCLVLTARREDALRETVSLIARSDSEPGISTGSDAGNVNELPDTILVYPGDICEESFVLDLFAAIQDKFGRLDLLFNNAGTSAPQVPIEDLPLSAFEHTLRVNLVAAFLCTREATRLFKSQVPQGGRIINNGSISAHTPRPHSSPYTTSKHAIAGLTKSTALDGRAFNISCTQLDIGNAHTPLASGLAVGTLQPDGRTLAEATFDVRHVADAVVHIAGLPPNVSVLEMVILAIGMPYVGRG